MNAEVADVSGHGLRPMNRLELKRWRAERHLTLVELGELLGVDKQTVFRWEAGTSTVPPYLHLALAQLDATTLQEIVLS